MVKALPCYFQLAQMFVGLHKVEDKVDGHAVLDGQGLEAADFYLLLKVIWVVSGVQKPQRV